MQSSRSTLGRMALIAAVALLSAVSYVGECVTRCCRSIGDTFGSYALKVVAAVPATDTGVSLGTLRGYVQARAHAVRQLCRPALRIEAGWRLCPSV